MRTRRRRGNLAATCLEDIAALSRRDYCESAVSEGEPGERSERQQHRRKRAGRGPARIAGGSPPDRERPPVGPDRRRGDCAGRRRARARRGPAGRFLRSAGRAPHRGGGARRRGRGGRGRRGARGLDGHAAALPEGHRPRTAADGRAGGRAREADRARRPLREAGDGGGEPPPRRLDREALPQPGSPVPRPDPGGHDRARPGRREVRLPQGLQVLDLRHVVDQAGSRARARRQGADDPDAGARRREAQQDRPHGALAARQARSRAELDRDRRSSST